MTGVCIVWVQSLWSNDLFRRQSRCRIEVHTYVLYCGTGIYYIALKVGAFFNSIIVTVPTCLYVFHNITVFIIRNYCFCVEVLKGKQI